MSVNWQQSKICIVINDKSQGSTAKHLCWDELLNYKVIILFANERIFQNRRTFGEVTDKSIVSFFDSLCSTTKSKVKCGIPQEE